jgi:hypothetical protein
MTVLRDDMQMRAARECAKRASSMIGEIADRFIDDEVARGTPRFIAMCGIADAIGVLLALMVSTQALPEKNSKQLFREMLRLSKISGNAALDWHRSEHD